MRSLIRRVLMHPRLHIGLVIVSVVTVLPALAAGWIGDDWIHRAVLGSHEPFGDVDPVRDLFQFMSPGQHNDSLSSVGLIPWWADPEVRSTFFRPLSSLTHMLDQALWPHSAVLQHLHSLVWGALMVWCGLRLMREEASTPLAAGLAALCFALEDSHTTALTWLANRNALITTTCAILSVHAFVRWRKTGAWRMWAVSMGVLVVGLGTGEAALGACAWMAARVLTQERPRAWASLAGPVVIVVVWRLLYDVWGYGAFGSGVYVDPGASPLRFLGLLMERWPILAGGVLFSAPIDVWIVLPTAERMIMALMGTVGVAGFGVLAWPTLRARPAARTAALALALILVPLVATAPMDRLFAFASLAGALLLAELVAHERLLDAPLVDQEPASWSPRTWLVAALLLMGSLVSGAARPLRCAALPLAAKVFEVGADTAPRDAAVGDRTMVFVHANVFASVYTYVKRSVPPHDHGRPGGIALLASGWDDVIVTREDASTLVLTPARGFLARPLAQLFRDPVARPFVEDERIEHYGMAVHVRSVTEDGRPAVVAFHFADPLEDETHRQFVTLTLDGVVPWAPPAIGESVVLSGML